MMLKKIACIALLGAVTGSVAVQAQLDANSGSDRLDGQQKSDTTFNPLVATPEPGFIARTPLQKRDVVLKPARTEGRLIVKFGDAVQMRPLQNGSVASLKQVDVSSIQAMAERFGVTFRTAMTEDQQALDMLLETAKQRSGKMQPDLNGMMYVEGPEFALHRAAEALHGSDLVEFVHWDEYKIQLSPDDDIILGGDPTGSCCYDDNGLSRCTVVTETTCLDTLGGTYFGDGTACSADDLCEACCVNENCTLVRETADCNAPGATPTDRGQVCSGNICTTGTCCDFPVGGCNDDIVGWDCVDGGGTFGQGLTCADDDPCAASTGACCLPPFTPESCAPLTIEDCYLVGGYYWGDDAQCIFGDDLDEFTCGELELENGHPAQGDCYDLDGLPHPFCTENPGNLDPPDSPWPQPGLGDFGICGDLICDTVDQYCCDVKWDTFCARAAHEFCANGSPCSSQFKGSCYEPNGGGGCNDSTCCGIVTFVNGGCATSWTQDCVQIALNFCGAGTGGCGTDTPNLKNAQAYMSAGGFPGPAFIPGVLEDIIPTYDPPDDNPDLGELILDGFNGAGWNFYTAGEDFTDLNNNNWWDVGEPFVDDDADGIWDRPGGLYGFGEQLLYEYGINMYSEFLGPGQNAKNMARGESTRIALIDRAIYADHEDLAVTVEPGQTQILIPEVTAPHHATAVAGVMNAQLFRQNGIRGVDGIAPYADLLFFPMTSVEDGAREMQAWNSALQSLAPGDVICVPYGPTVTANINTIEANHTLVNLATDLGYIVVLAAGNTGANLDDSEDFGDNGAIVVGACSPGAPFYRFDWDGGASNYMQTADPQLTRGNSIHLKGWGANVATTGWGGLFAPDCGDGTGPDPTRSYTNSFGGTSAATAQIAGICSCLQGLARQIYGLPIVADQMRIALGLRGQIIPPPTRLFGSNDGTWLDLDTQGTANFAGGTIELVGTIDSATSNLLNLEDAVFDDSSALYDLWILKGDKLIGNRYSVKADDQNYLAVRSEWTERDADPGMGGENQDLPLPDGLEEVADDLIYLATAQVVDVLYQFILESSNVSTIEVEFNLDDHNLPMIHVVEFYDWLNGRWVFQRVSVFTPPDEDAIDAGDFTEAPEGDYDWTTEEKPLGRIYVRDDGVFVCRHYVIAFPGPLGGLVGRGTEDNTFDFRMDLVNLLVDGGEPGFGQINNGGGLNPPAPLPAPVPNP